MSLFYQKHIMIQVIQTLHFVEKLVLIETNLGISNEFYYNKNYILQHP